MKKILLLLLAVFGLQAVTQGQITISPTNVFIDSPNRFGSYMVINSGEQPQEINIDFIFGYFKMTDSGNRELVRNDSALATNFSAVPWIRAFPKKFVLQPDERQIIRMRINAPQELQNGMYWARIQTTSSVQAPPIGQQVTDSVAAQIGIKLRLVTGLFYKAGNVSTGIDINNLQAAVDTSDTLWLTANINRTGNAPFLGSIYAEVYNKNGKKVARSVVVTTIYFDGTLKRSINIKDLPNGEYIAKLRFETQRSDIPPEKLVQMQPVAASTEFSVR